MNTSRRVETIDGLRGIASLSVVVYHYLGFLPLFGIALGTVGGFLVDVTRYGHLGVQVFFVLSGYVIAMTGSNYAFAPRVGSRFLLRRLVRLVPPYWAVVLLIAITLLVGKGAGYFDNTPLSATQVAAHLVYAQGVLGFPWLDLAHWSLCLEVQFYLVFACSSVALSRFSVDARAAWFGALTLGSLLIAISGTISPFWFPTYWYQFGTGVLVYFATRTRSARVFLGVFLPILLVEGIVRHDVFDIAIALVAAFLVVSIGSPRVLARVPRVLLRLGTISYSLYLTQFFGGLALSIAFRAGLIRSPGVAWAAVTFATIAAVGFAALFYYVFERRAVDWSRRVRIEGVRDPLITQPEEANRQAEFVRVS